MHVCVFMCVRVCVCVCVCVCAQRHHKYRYRRVLCVMIRGKGERDGA